MTRAELDVGRRLGSVNEPAVSIIEEDTGAVADKNAHRRFRTAIAGIVIAGVVVAVGALALTRPSPTSAASPVVVDVGLDGDISQSEINKMLDWFDAEPTVIDQRVVISLPFDRMRIYPATCIGNVSIRLLVEDMTTAASLRRLVFDRYPGPDAKINSITTARGDMATAPVYCTRDVNSELD